MKITVFEKEAIATGNFKVLKDVLLREKELHRVELSTFKAGNQEYDNFLKGKLAVMQELIKVLEF